MKKLLFVLRQFVKMFLQSVVLPLYYRVCSVNPVDEKSVIFADAHNKEMPYSMEALHKKFVENGYRVTDMFSDYGHDGFVTTAKNMFRFMKLYSTAHYVVICDYFLPVSSCKKRSETKVVQLWHACGIFKRFGHDADDDIPKYYIGEVIKNLDLVTVSSQKCVPVYSKAMHLKKGVCRSVGVSRTDRYFADEYAIECRDALYKMYPQARGKKIALWAPTFRGNAGLPYLEGKEDILDIKEKLSDEWFLLVRLHPHFHDKTISCPIPTERLLPVVDLLISDYSTVIFEYSLFEKPLVLFAPDYNTYGSKRGFYIDYKSLPGKIVTDKNELCEAILNCEEEFDRAKMQNFRAQYMSGCDGKSTKRIFDIITNQTNKK